MIATLIAVVAGVGLLNVMFDPLGVFDSPRFKQINFLKPYLDHHRELVRYHRVTRLCPDTGIFGNSRAEVGFDPESPSFISRRLSAFNHAIPGSAARTALTQLNWLQGAHCFPKTIILGVDFFDFLGGTILQPVPSLESHPPPQRDIRFFVESVFSITGFRDSITTLFLQKSPYPATLTDRGFNPLENYIPEVEQSGHYMLFRQRAGAYVRNWTRKPFRLNPPNGEASDDEAMLDAILNQANQSNSITYLVIYPYHAEIRLIMERLGMSQLFADWKRMVVGAAERSIALGGNVQVWDFSGVGSETLETIPARGDRKTHLAYYWEAGHFKKELGDQVLDRLLGKQSNFGVRLDGSNVEQWLAEEHGRVKSLLDTPSALLSEVDDLIARHNGN